MNDALGLVEIKGLAGAIAVADAMVKTANVGLIGIEKAKGFGWITIKVCGDVGAVTASVQTGRAVAEQNGQLVSFKVIPRPAPSIGEMFCNISKSKPEPPPQDPEPGEPVPPNDLPPEGSPSDPSVQQEDPEETKEPVKDAVQAEVLPEETEILSIEAASDKAEPLPEESKILESAVPSVELSVEKEEAPLVESQIPTGDALFPIDRWPDDSNGTVREDSSVESQPKEDSTETETAVTERKATSSAKKGRPAKSPGRPAKNKRKPADTDAKQPEEGSR